MSDGDETMEADTSTMGERLRRYREVSYRRFETPQDTTRDILTVTALSHSP